MGWFTSYLSNGSQRIYVDGHLSDRFPLNFGVPQGSCLGPLLFTIYASKLFEVIKYHLPDAHAYADDSQLYIPFRPDSEASQQSAVKAMELCIRDIQSWMVMDKLWMNNGKTLFMIVGTNPQLAKVDINNIMVGSTEVGKVPVVKNLGSMVRQ